MKKRTLAVIVTFSALALFSLVIIQLFWILNAFDLAEKQFDHRVNLALTETISEMERILPEIESCPGNGSNNEECRLFQVMDVKLLDSLLSKYISYNQLSMRYEYRIVKTASDSVVFQTDAILPSVEVKPFKVCLSCLYQQEIFHLELLFPHKKRFLLIEMGLWLLASMFFLIVVIIGFTMIVYYTIRQKKIGQVKDDFINNMTHEFQTPISTISLASEVLIKSGENPNKGMVQQYAKIIYDENFRLRTHVDRVLQLALLENGDVNIEKNKLDLHQIVRDSIKNLCLEHCEKDVEIQYELNASPSIVMADVLHLTNIVTNIVDNAVKYSGEKLKLSVSTENMGKGILLAFTDNGFGIPHARKKLIFEKFSRLKKGDTHDVKGFGIGLYYVKTMVEAHGGKIDVNSEPGKGSRFEVFLPYDGGIHERK